MRKVKRNPRALIVSKRPRESTEAAAARTAFEPAVNAAVTAGQFQCLPGDLDITALVAELERQCTAVARGKLGRPEALLTAQAHTLNAIFNSLAQRAALNLGEYPEAGERYLRLALKAQSQCRATLETLGNLRNPPMVIARQANVTSGPQQVNNGLAREIYSEQNKLLEQTDGERLDFPATGKTGGADQDLEAVGAVNRTGNDRR